MWLFEVLCEGFVKPVPILPILVFRILFSIWCLLKFTTETRRGYFRYFDTGTYLYVSYHAHNRHSLINISLYRTIYILKILAAFALFSGWFVTPALAILAFSFFIEIKIYFKFHANLFLLCTLILMLSPDLDRALRLGRTSPDPGSLLGDPLPQVLIVTTMSIVYVATAVRKLNRAFLSGAVVFGTVQHLLDHQHQRRFFDAIFPAAVRKFLFEASDTVLKRRWTPLMVTTIALEIILPFALSTSRLWPYAALAGTVMHLCFTLLSPATLLHFSLLSVSIYLLFMDPSAGAALVGGWFCAT